MSAAARAAWLALALAFVAPAIADSHDRGTIILERRGSDSDPEFTLAPRTPEIFAVVVIHDQQAQAREGEPEYAYYKYPFLPNGRVELPDWRELMVVGRNLPMTPSGREVTSGDPTISYAWGTELPRDYSKHPLKPAFDIGWRKVLEGFDPETAEAIRSLEALTLRVKLHRGVLPGPKTFRLNGAEGSWTLAFGDNTAAIRFVRDERPGRTEPTDDLFLPEQFRLEVHTGADLPLKSVGLRLGNNGSELSVRGSPILLASRVGPKIYRTQVMRLVEKGFSSGASDEVPVEPYDRLVGTLHRQDGLLDAVPPYVTAEVALSPREFRSSWHDALAKVARCRNEVVQDPNAYAMTVTGRIPNVIVFDSEHFRLNVIRAGHHAAMLLLRDTYLQMIRVHHAELREFRTPTALRGLRKIIGARLSDKDFPMGRIRVKSPDGGPMTLSAINNLEWIQQYYKISAAAARVWADDAFKEGFEIYRDAVRDAVEHARKVDACSAEELLKLTGVGFHNVAARLRPRLMEAKQPEGTWVPDILGRRYLDQLQPLAAAVLKQQAENDKDNAYVMIGVTLLTLPLMASESLLVVAIAFAVDAADLAYTVVSEVGDYLESNREYTFSLGSSAVLGTARLDEAELRKREWYQALLSIGPAALGTALGGWQMISAVRSAAAARAFRQFAHGVAAGGKKAFDTLPNARQLEFQRYLQEAALAREAGETLTSDQQRALGILERLGREAAAEAPETTRAYRWWKLHVTDETRAMLDANPALERFYARAGKEVREVLTECASPCIPRNATEQDAARIKALLERFHPSKADIKRLKRYFRSRSDNLGQAITELEAATSVHDMRARTRQPLGSILREQPDGEKMTVVTRLGAPVERMNAERLLEGVGVMDYPNYERAHSVGAGMGVESSRGILYAPRVVNQEVQNRGIEKFIRDYYARRAPGVDLILTTEAKRKGNTLLLDEINYELRATRNDGREPTLLFSATINVRGSFTNPKALTSGEFVNTPEVIESFMR